MQEVLSFLAAKDFHPPKFDPDGKIFRFSRHDSKDSAWLIAWQNARLNTGEFYYVCSFGDWRTGETHLYKPDKMTKAEYKAIDEQIQAKQTAIEKEAERVRLEVADLAERRFNGAPKVGTTPYMLRKKIEQPFGCCFYQDRVQVPMRSIDGVLWNLQSIFADGQKRFMKGGRKKGTFHVIGEPIGEAPIYIAEGFATAVSVHMATGKTVLVAFDAGNLLEVVAEVVRVHPRLAITICGDDDRKNPENPGRKKAEKAATLAAGLAVFPEFPEEDGTSSDFNDLHVLYGLQSVKEQLIAPIEQTTGFVPLGYDESTHFFYHIPSKDIAKATTFHPIQMYRLAPMEYWQARYPTKKGPADLHLASHDLVQLSCAVGPFDSTRIRGTGVWLDNDRVVINTGHSLIVDKREMSLSALRSHHIYIQTRNRMPRLHPEPLSSEEFSKLRQVAGRFRFKSPSDQFLLMGWLMLARIAGALPIRPHLWITGGKGTGKSTLMEQFIAPLLGNPKGKMHLIGATTEAGIRQALKASSLPIIFDEFESTSKLSKERVENVIELLRNSWSTSQGKILKGSSGGSSVEFQLHFAALLSSIRVKLDNDADRSRFSILELGEHGSNVAEWKMLNNLLSAITEEIGERLFARACLYPREIIESGKVIAPFLARAVNQRFAQQHGALLGSWWMGEHDEVINEEQAESLSNEFCGEAEEEMQDELSDEQECLNALLTWSVSLRNESGSTAVMTIADAIKNDAWKHWIIFSGIKVDKDKFHVANKHTELEKFYANTRWAGNWHRSLRRLPNAQAHLTTFGARGTGSRCVSLPISLV